MVSSSPRAMPQQNQPVGNSSRRDFTISPPPSTNALYNTVILPGGKKTKRVKSKAYKDWLSAAGWELKTARVKPLLGPISVVYICPRNARRDLGNYEKPLSDLLVANGIISDDRHIREIWLAWSDDWDMVRVTITGVPT
jgi:crossover junction endodeoxyribonuclease RusA